MKKQVTLLFIILPFVLMAQTWQWANSAYMDSMSWGPQGPYNNSAGGNDIVITSSDEVICTGGYAYGFLIFPQHLQVGGGGNSNGFICKYNSNGNFVTAATASGGYAGHGQYYGGYLSKMALDEYDNVYVVGCAGGAVNFGPASFSGRGVLTYFENSPLQLSCSWAKQLSYDAAFDNIFLRNHQLYLDGNFDQTCLVDTAHLFNPDTWDYPKEFIVKTDTAGHAEYIKQSYGGLTAVAINAIRNNELFIWFAADSCFIFDTISFCTAHPQHYQKYFDGIAKADMNGNVKWRNIYSGVGRSWIGNVKTDSLGNLYAVGYFDSVFYMPNQTLYKPAGVSSVGFITKYDNGGNLIWLKKFYSSNSVFPSCDYTDNSGNTYIAGRFSGTLIFGNDTVTAQSNSDMFIVRYNSDGVYLGIKTVTNAEPSAITQDSYGNAYVTGSILSATNFDNIQLADHTLSSAFFVAKLSAITGVFNALSSIESPQTEFTLYPNPATTQLSIQTNGTTIEQVNIYNTTGSLVMATVGSTMVNGQLSIVHLPSGLYIADIKTKEGSARKRWVKM